jgi:fungal nitric oxide reductase
VEKKEKEPSNDIVSRLAVEQVRQGKLTHDELVAMVFLLLVAGNATTANMIALGVFTLLQHPDQLAELHKDPSLIKGAVEEILRYLTGSQFATRRVALENVDVGGQTIQKGEGVWALNASANDDESVFADPSRFDIHRQPNPHLAFGDGIHKCIAEHLARIEIEIAIATLIRRLPKLQLAVSLDEIQYVTNPAHDFAVTTLPIKW